MAGKFSLVSGSSDHTARLWVKDRCIKTLQGEVTACSFMLGPTSVCHHSIQVYVDVQLLRASRLNFVGINISNVAHFVNIFVKSFTML